MGKRTLQVMWDWRHRAGDVGKGTRGSRHRGRGRQGREHGAADMGKRMWGR